MFFSVFVNDMFANLGEMVYLYTSMGTTLVNTLVSMLCAVSLLKGECRAGLVSAGGWWLVAGNDAPLART